MKLRIRSAVTKETFRVDAPDSCFLFDLKTLVASKLSSTALIPPDAIHLSLNRVDEVLASSPRESLSTLGLTSGDLLFYSLDSGFYSRSEVQIPVSVSPVETLAPPPPAPVAMNCTCPSDSLYEASTDDMDVKMDSEPCVHEKVPSVPSFLQRVMEAERENINGNMALAIVTIHAVFLESGFVACSSAGGSSLREGYASAAHLVSLMFTLPELISRGDMDDVKNVILKISPLGNHVSVYGYLVGAHPDVYHLLLDSSMLAYLLALARNELSLKEEDDVFQIWKIVKDHLSLPLLIDICQKNGLLLPPCFSRLPTDLKIMILEFLPGIELAKIACTCSELRYLSSNDELWRRKFFDEFEISDARNVGPWKAIFTTFCMKRKILSNNRSTALVPYIRTPRIMPVPRMPGGQWLPMSGGDYDRFPTIGHLGSLSRAGFNRHAGRRFFSPNCNLGSGGFT